MIKEIEEIKMVVYVVVITINEVEFFATADSTLSARKIVMYFAKQNLSDIIFDDEVDRNYLSDSVKHDDLDTALIYFRRSNNTDFKIRKAHHHTKDDNRMLSYPHTTEYM